MSVNLYFSTAKILVKILVNFKFESMVVIKNVENSNYKICESFTTKNKPQILVAQLIFTNR